MAWLQWLLSKTPKLGDTRRAISFGQHPTKEGEGVAQMVEEGSGAARTTSGRTVGGEFFPDGVAVDSDDVLVSLNATRAAPGTEVTDLLGDSLAGTSLTVVACDGDAVLKLRKASDVLTGLTDTAYGTLEFVQTGSKIIRTTGTWDDRTGGDVLNYSAVGTKVTVTGSTSNNNTFTVASVGTTVYAGDTLIVDEVLTDEVASATESVSGYRPKTGVTLHELTYPAMIVIEEVFDKVFIENDAQTGKSLVLHVAG
jgi:hypothetical protein